MNTKNNDIKNKPFIKTVCTTLACLVASSAFALDDRMDQPKPDNEPDPKETPEHPPQPDLPELVPFTSVLTVWEYWDFAHVNYHFLQVYVANWGKADAPPFEGQFGMRVLETLDPVKYPVGYTEYVGTFAFEDGLKVGELDVADHNYGIYVPEEVLKCEIYVIVDRHWDYIPGWDTSSADGTSWDDDTGKELAGAIAELDEHNNVDLGFTIQYYADGYKPEPKCELPKFPLVREATQPVAGRGK